MGQPVALVLELADVAQLLACSRGQLFEQLDEQPRDVAGVRRGLGEERRRTRVSGVSAEAATPPAFTRTSHLRSQTKVDRAGEPGGEAVDRERASASASRRTASGSAPRGRPSRRSRAPPTSAGPRTPLPSLPKSSGSFSSAAAPMIGVASRNAKRAASLFESPTRRLPPIAAPRAREAWDRARAPAPRRRGTPSRKPTVRAIRVSSSASVCGARRRSTLGAVEQHAVQRSGRPPPTAPRRRRLAQLVLEQQPEHAGGDRADDEQPAELRVGVVRVRCRGRAASGRARAGSAPSRARRTRAARARSRGASRRGTSGSTGRSGGCSSRGAAAGSRCARGSRSGRAPRRPGGARGRSPGDRRSARRGSRGGTGQAARFGPVRNQAKTKQASPRRSAAIPCFDVMVARARLVAGEEARQRARRLGEVDDRDHDEHEADDEPRARRGNRSFRIGGAYGSAERRVRRHTESQPLFT